MAYPPIWLNARQVILEERFARLKEEVRANSLMPCWMDCLLVLSA